jgi:large subunit ribosomal protein L32
MAVPKRRLSISKKNRRRRNIFLKVPKLIKCSKCGKPVLPHTVCGYCGFYKGKEYINVMAKLEKKEQKKRAKEIEAQEKETNLKPEELSKK